MSFNKENEMLNNILNEDIDNSYNCSKQKSSQKNSLTINNGNNIQDEFDPVENGSAALDNIKSSSNNSKSNGKSHELQDNSQNSNIEAEFFRKNFFSCLKYFVYKKEFKKNRRMEVAENNYYLIRRNWVFTWKAFANYKTFKKFFAEINIEKINNLICLEEEKFFDNEKFIKLKNVFYEFASNRDLNLNSVRPPEPIDNARLLRKIDEKDPEEYSVNPENYSLEIENLKYSDQITIISEQQWLFFHSKFSGGPSIQRKAIVFIEDNQKIEVESKFLELNIIVVKNRENIQPNGENTYYFKCAVSKNNFLSDIKEIVKKKLISKSQNEILLNFLNNNEFHDQFKSLNSEYWEINLLNRENNTKFDLNLIKKFNYVLQKKIKESDAKNFSINSDCFENINYDKQNNLLNLKIINDACLFIELTDENNTTILNTNRIKNSDYQEGDCSKCFKRKILYHGCLCNKVSFCSQMCYNKGMEIHSEDCLHLKFNKQNLEKTNESQNGICGLSNLGNTCYMNTALQCLSNCKELTEYFIEGFFLDHVNTKNSLSTGGKLAYEFCILLKNLWYNNQSSFTPTSFKSLVGNLNHIFMGYDQHDTHEFLNFFLDKLNDDINRVSVEKSAIKMLSSKEENEPDIHLKADLYWNFIKQRNQSIITDLFYGQYLSTIKCPVCDTTSTNFDPFLSLTIPIPRLNQEREFTFECYFIFFDLKFYPLKITLNINRKIKIFQLRKFIGTILKINPLSFYTYYIGFGSVVQILECSDYINSENAVKRVFMFQIDPKIFNNSFNLKLQELVTLKNQILNVAGLNNLKNKLEYLSINAPSEVQNENLLHDSNEKSVYLDQNNKDLNDLVRTVSNQSFNSNQVLKEILVEHEEIDKIETESLSATYKTIGFYSFFGYNGIDALVNNLFEVLFQKIGEKESNLNNLLREKLIELTIKNKLLHSENNKESNGIENENKENLSDSIDHPYNNIEQNHIKDLLNKIKEIDINEKINVLNNFNFMLNKEPEFEKIAYNSDENNYLKDNFLKCVLDFFTFEKEKNNGNDRTVFCSSGSILGLKNKKSKISPAVIITINKEWSLEYLNEYIHDFIKNLIVKDPKNGNFARNFNNFDYNSFKGHENKKDLFANHQIPFMILIKTVFLSKKVKVLRDLDLQENLNKNAEIKQPDYIFKTSIKGCNRPILNNINYEEDYEKTQNPSPKNFDATLNNFKETNIKEQEQVKEKDKNIYEEKEIRVCIFCEKEVCDGCNLPDISSMKVSDLLTKYKDFNQNYDIKNEFLYINKNCKDPFENESNLDFSLELAIQPEFKECIESIRSVNTNNLKFDAHVIKEFNLINCFDNFQKEEKLEKTNEWKCPKCNDFRQAKKKIQIYRAPKILIIHLNRFSHLEGKKINTEIDFQLDDLNLNKFVVNKRRENDEPFNEESPEEDQVYDLFAIANHFGSLDGGHYIAAAKNPYNSEWYQFNDSNVSRLRDLNKSAAYLLFYRKKCLDSEDGKEIFTKNFKNYH